MTRKTSFSSPSPRPPRSLILRDFCLLREWKSCPKWIVLRECPFFRLRGFLLFSRSFSLFFFFFPTTIVPRLTRQRPCLPFPSILFAWRMYPIIYKNFVDVIFSMKIKKCVLRSEKKNFDRFRIIVHYRLRIYTIFNYRCVYTYKNTLYCIIYIRIPPNIFIERGRVSILFWFPPPFERAVPTRHSELGVV